MTVPRRFAAAAFVLTALAGCQPAGSTDTAAAAPPAACAPGIGSHLCSTGPAEPTMGLDPSLVGQEGGRAGGGH